MQHSGVAARTRERLNRLASEYQFFILDENKNICGIGRSVPLDWNGAKETLPAGYDEARTHAVAALPQQRSAHALLGLSITIPPCFRKRGVSSIAIRAMKALCSANGHKLLVIAARPILKALYPLTSIAEYASWTDDEGLPFDPWLRLHVRHGAQMLNSAPKSMMISGSVADWETWTGLRFPRTGAYVIPGGGSPGDQPRQR